MAKSRKFHVFRLFEDDRKLLQEIGKGAEDRHAALLALVDVLPDLEIDDIRKRKRRPLRIGIPTELEEAIDAVVHRTGQTFTDVLLLAASEYRRRSPLV